MPFSNLNTKTFQALFNFASIGILVTNSNGEIQMANKFIEYQFGYSDQELFGLKVESLIPSRFKKKHVQHRENYNSDPHSRPMGLGMELWGLKKNGVEFPVEVSLGYFEMDEERFALAFVSDITQRKETENAVVELNAHLEEKVKEGSQSLAFTVAQLSAQIKETERKDKELERVNTFLNNIWNHAGAIILVCDKAGIIQFFNPAAENSLGYTSAEIVNIHTPVIFHSPDELSAKAAEYSVCLNREVKPDFSVLEASAELNKGVDGEWYYVKKDKSLFYVSLNITPLKGAHQEVTSYLIIAIDISEKKKAEVELLAALEKERELNELKSRFVSMASHEFRTPLSAVLSSAYLLSKYTKDTEQPQRDKHIQRIVTSVASLTEILNDFLSVGKIEEGNIRPNYSEFNIEKLIGDIVLEVNHLLKSGQAVSYVHTGVPNVTLDASMMRHIVINLLSNAVKFSPEDSVVDLVTENLKKEFILVVRDRGIGIPKEDIPSLSKRFFRSSNVTNIQGTGLGLHIVNKYAELMNGKLTCSSTLGKGTEFTIRFNKATKGV